MLRRIFTWGLVVVLGLFVLYGVYDRLSTTKVLKSYQETFQLLEHPQGTTIIDAFQFKFSYYPATYRDESIQNQCAYLVGELRSYSNDWDELKTFYQDKTLAHRDTGKINVGIFPIKLVSEGGAAPWFDLDSVFSYSPFDVDVLARLESHYYFLGFPEGLSEGKKDVYAVFIAPDCE